MSTRTPAASNDSRHDDPRRDDRLLPLTRWVAILVVPILAAASLVLYGQPGRTTELFAWTIRPDMTPLLMGAGYGAGVYFFSRVARSRSWHRVALPFLGIATFTWFMAAATVLHWDRFNHAHVTFVLWVVIYGLTPLVIPLVWVLNRRTDPGVSTPDGPETPRTVRLIAVGVGALIVLTALALFLVPGPMVDHWVWATSPFTARVLVGWFALFGVVAIGFGLEPRWSAVRITVQSVLVGFLLIFVGIGRAWGDFQPASAGTVAFLGGLLVVLVGLGLLYVRLERGNERPDASHTG